MASHYVKRMLPLVDIVILLFGFMTIILMAARIDEAPVTTDQPESKTGTAAREPEIAAILVSAILEHKTIILLEIDKDLRLTDENQIPLGSVDSPSGSLLQRIQSAPEADRLVLCQYPAGFECSKFDPQRQNQLKEVLGRNNVVYLVKPLSGVQSK